MKEFISSIHALTHPLDEGTQLQGIPQPVDQRVVVLIVQTALGEVHVPGLVDADVENQCQEDNGECATPVFAVAAKEQDILAIQHSMGC